jgi:maltose alpha-D-glucosyltransferase/alpha-amylase
MAQRQQLDSLLSWMQRVILVRRQSPGFGWGTFRSLETSEDAVLAKRCDWEGGTVIAVHNLSGITRTVRIEAASDPPTPVVEISASNHASDDHQGIDTVCPEPYGYRWYRCGGVRL